MKSIAYCAFPLVLAFAHAGDQEAGGETLLAKPSALFNGRDASGGLAGARDERDENALREKEGGRPVLVGRFGAPGGILFEGNSQVSTGELRKALSGSGLYFLSAHPKADFEACLGQLQRCLEAGYRANGFPESQVGVRWDEGRKQVVATLREGPRYEMGRIRIQGANQVSVPAMMKALVNSDEDKQELSPEDASYEQMAKAKEFAAGQLQKNLEDAFPEVFLLDEVPADPLDPFLTGKTETEFAPWKTGDWADFRASQLSLIKSILEDVYMMHGLYDSEFDVKFVPGEGADRMDLQIKVVREGSRQIHGKIHIYGNKRNPRADVLAYLGISEGLAIQGNCIKQIKRKLFDSGRFLGWQVVARRDPLDKSRLDLFIQVSEDWEVPLLAQSLTPEQELMLRFAKGLNSGQFLDLDLVLKTTIDQGSGPIPIVLAMAEDQICGSLDAGGERFAFYSQSCGDSRIGLKDGSGKRCVASVSMGKTPFEFSFEVLNQHKDDPFDATGSIGFGMRGCKDAGNFLVLALDPLSMLKWGGGARGVLMEFVDGDLLLSGEGMRMRIDGRTGKLVSFRMKNGNNFLEISHQKDFVRRFMEDFDSDAKGAEELDLGEGKSALIIHAALVMLDYVYNDGLRGSDRNNPSVVIKHLLHSNQRLAPLTRFLTDLVDPIAASFLKGDAVDGHGRSSFGIPMDGEGFISLAQMGNPLQALMAIGVYECLSDLLEPGTWVDLLMREMVFHLSGNSTYRDETVRSLLEDETMGPVGSLLCAQLLEMSGDPLASKFTSKANAEMNAAGFGKDWRLLYRGGGKQNGLAWGFIDGLAKLDEREIVELVPGELSKLLPVLKKMRSMAKEQRTDAGMEAFGTVMDSIWGLVVKDVVVEQIHSLQAGSKPVYDPAIVAATVDDVPVLRAAVKLMEKLAEKKGSFAKDFQMFNMLSAFVHESRVPGSSVHLENCVSVLLMATRNRMGGWVVSPEFIHLYSGKIAGDLGKDGLDQILKMGFTKEQYMWWVEQLLAAEFYAGGHLKKVVADNKPEDEQIRSYYESHKHMFSKGDVQVRLFTIRRKVDGEEQDALNLMKRIREKVVSATSMEARIKAFMEQAKAHSDEVDAGPGGDRGWIVPSSEFSEIVAEAVSKVPDESLSEVIRVELAGSVYHYLVLIPEKRRSEDPLKSKAIETAVIHYMVMDKALEELRKAAKVRLLDAPVARNAEPGFLQKVQAPGLEGIEKDMLTKANEDLSRAMHESRKLKDPYADAVRKAGSGDGRAMFQLGTYAEQGLAPESGITAAVRHYERAAEKQDIRAMLRLSEIYRLGIGVKRDPEKAKQWRKNASKLIAD